MNIWSNGKVFAVQSETYLMGSSAWDYVACVVMLSGNKFKRLELENFKSTSSRDGKWNIVSVIQDVDCVIKKEICPTCGKVK